MGLRREILQIVFGAFLLALMIGGGWIKQSNPFWDNVLGGAVVMIVSRFLALVFGGKGK